MGWLIPIAYILIGAMLVPRFTKSAYEAKHARWHSIQTRAQSLREGAFDGWAQSLVWPVFLVIHIAVAKITAEERAEAEALERAKTVAGAKVIIACYEAEERAKWSSEFNKGGRK